jgi:biotin carboxyl carrier protein
MARAKVVSLHVRPLQASHLCFEVDGVLGQLNTQLGAPIVASSAAGAGATVFDFDSFHAVLGSAQTVAGDPSRLLFDFLQIQAATKTSTLASLRAENRKAALDRAINARQNAYFAKYNNAPAIIARMNEHFSPSIVGSKPQRLAVLAGLSEDQWSQLKDVYSSEGRTGVIRNTISEIQSDTASYGYSGASSETAQVAVGSPVPGNLASQLASRLPQPPNPWPPPAFGPNPPQPPPAVRGSEWLIGSANVTELTEQQSTSYQVVSSGDATSQVQTITNTDYGYRVPYYEAAAQYERAQISLIDQQFAQFMYSQNLPHLAQVFRNELSSIDGDVFRLQIAYLNTILMSPVPGIVTGIYKNSGDAVRAGETVIRVENNAILLLVATVVHRGAITIGSHVEVRTNLFDSANEVTLPGKAVAVRGQRDDDHWEVIVQCNNLDGSGNPLLPFGYHFDYDDTILSIS